MEMLPYVRLFLRVNSAGSSVFHLNQNLKDCFAATTINVRGFAAYMETPLNIFSLKLSLAFNEHYF